MAVHAGVRPAKVLTVMQFALQSHSVVCGQPHCRGSGSEFSDVHVLNPPSYEVIMPVAEISCSSPTKMGYAAAEYRGMQHVL
jgi:hypothetical protein